MIIGLPGWRLKHGERQFVRLRIDTKASNPKNMLLLSQLVCEASDRYTDHHSLEALPIEGKRKRKCGIWEHRSIIVWQFVFDFHSSSTCPPYFRRSRNLGHCLASCAGADLMPCRLSMVAPLVLLNMRRSSDEAQVPAAGIDMMEDSRAQKK